MSLPSEERFKRIKSFKDYNDLVASGHAWEFFPDLELTYGEFLAAKLRWRIKQLRERKNPFNNQGDNDAPSSQN